MKKSQSSCWNCSEGEFKMSNQTDTDQPKHEMPPMGEGLMSWGFAAFFILPVILLLMVFLIPRCSSAGDGVALPENQADTVQTSVPEEN